jgi:hypothetical protein
LIVDRRAVVAVLAALTLAVALVAAPALAHETNEVGDLSLEIGWGTEPAYVGQLNSVQVIVTHKADGDPIEDPGASLAAAVSYGDKQTSLELAPNFESIPGEYRALLIPTAPGDYTFHITGKVEGLDVDVEVTSSPKTFSPVEDASTVQFPVKAPTNAELAQRLDTELGRLSATSDVSGAKLPTESDVSSARLLGIAGIVVGAIGVVLAAVALLRRRA